MQSKLSTRIARLLSVPVSGVAAIALFGSPLSTPSAHAAERDASGVIEEIVVTSRRRAESVQDVPLSVTAFGEEKIDQIKPKTLRDFDGLAPNLYVGMNTAGPGASALYIRGVGYAGIEKAQTPQVGVIVDGVQMGSSTGQLIDAFDIESIEVNRGPQGVLYGKNTTGGNIVVNRVKPQFNEFGFKASASAGDYSSRQYKARINVPLVDDKLALKIGFNERSREGFYDNETLGGDQGEVDYSSQTVALRWLPSETAEVILTYDRIDDESEIPPQDPRYDGSQPFENRADKREPTEYEVDQLALRVNWDINDRTTLYSITGWHDSRDLVNQDFDGGSLDGLAIPFAQLHTLREQDYEVFTQELRLDFAVNDNIDLMGGIYYFDSDLTLYQLTNNVLQIPLGLPAGVPCTAAGFRDNPSVGNALCQFPNARSSQLGTEEVEAWSYFGNVTFRPTENLEFSIGARYIDEEKDGTNAYFDYTDGTYDVGGPAQEFDFLDLPSTPGTNYSVGDAWDDTLIQASARWDLGETNSVYASYSEGFRSGGLSIRSARLPEEATFDPEEAYQIEIGSKNEFFDRRLTLNLSVFYLELEGAQVASVITLPPGSIPGTTTIVNNEDTTEIEGIELESLWSINDNWSIGLNAGKLDLESEEYTIECQRVDACTGVPEGTLRTKGGATLGRAPEWNASLTVNFDLDLANGGHIGFNVSGKKFGNFILTETGGVGRLVEGGYSLVDARLQYDFPLGGNYASIALFGKNLTDSEYREQALFLGDGPRIADGGPATGFQGWGAPRTWALEFTYEMGGAR